jgi:hypothetical protein
VRAGLRRERASVRASLLVPGLVLGLVPGLVTGARLAAGLAAGLAEDFAAAGLPLLTCPLCRLCAPAGLVALRTLPAPLA